MFARLVRAVITPQPRALPTLLYHNGRLRRGDEEDSDADKRTYTAARRPAKYAGRFSSWRVASAGRRHVVSMKRTSLAHVCRASSSCYCRMRVRVLESRNKLKMSPLQIRHGEAVSSPIAFPLRRHKPETVASSRLAQTQADRSPTAVLKRGNETYVVRKRRSVISHCIV